MRSVLAAQTVQGKPATERRPVPMKVVRQRERTGASVVVIVRAVIVAAVPTIAVPALFTVGVRGAGLVVPAQCPPAVVTRLVQPAKRQRCIIVVRHSGEICATC